MQLISLSDITQAEGICRVGWCRPRKVCDQMAMPWQQAVQKTDVTVSMTSSRAPLHTCPLTLQPALQLPNHVGLL